MNSDSRLRSLRSHPMWALLLMFGMGLLLAGGSAFGVAGDGTPAKVVPQPRWNSSSSLQPGPILGDSTWFVGHSDPKKGDTLEYHGLDIENGMLFATTGQGLQIFDLKGQTPSLKSYIYGYFTGGQFPDWQHLGDKDWFLKYIDAPEGNSSVVALGMEEQGFAVVRASDPLLPVVAYQGKVPVTEVYSFNGGGTAWAYASAMDGGAIHRFNLTAASSMNKCLDVLPAITCPGVYKGVVSSMGIDNEAVHGVGNYLATGYSVYVRTLGIYQGFVKLWNISDPAAPTLITNLGVPALSVSMWQSGSSYYLATLDNSNTVTIYNASCVASGSCGSVPAIWSTKLTSPKPLSRLTVSKDGGKHYIYVGGNDFGSCAPQREYIFDVSTATSPEELTPKNDPAGYWGWYYMQCDTGFNLVGPHSGKVSGGVLYRAAMSLLDTHKIGHSGPPVANFTFGPKAPDTEIYAGAPIQFTDSSAGQVTSWSWSFQGGTPASATSRAPLVTFDTPGTKTVNLVVGNGSGLQSSPFGQPVTVLDPTPTLGSVEVSPTRPTVCQPVTLRAINPKGRSVLQYDFRVKNSAGTPVATAAGAAGSYIWNTGANTSAGSYTAELTLSNSAGSVTRTAAFTLDPLTTLPLAGSFSPSKDAFTAGTVNFHVSVPGATEWSWDFDDDMNPATTNWTAWSNNPITGPNPSHSYTSKGIHTVRVRVRNCTTAEVGVQSADLPVDIKVITPLKANFIFNALCTGGTCFVTAGAPVVVQDASTGAELWDYDWNGDGTYEDSGNAAPRTTHTFATEGTFSVKLRVRRGGNEESVDTKTVKVDPSGPAPVKSISISGPSTGQPGAALSFSASALNCTPSASWSWSAGDGTITGSGNQVSISWANQGNKTVSVTNSGCSGVTGSKSVTIGTGGGGGGGGSTTLKADFTFAPTAPGVGQAVNFNGATSTGSPTGYVWDFGDGTGFGSGAQTSHTYAKAGTYRVQLSVTKPGSCAPAPFCEAATIKTVVVGTGEAPLGAAFQTNATCISEFGLNVCSAQAGTTVTFTDQTTGGPTGWSWNFGDGDTANGASVSHVFKKNGTFTVTLTATRGATSSISSRTFNVTGGTTPPVASNTIVLPWIAQSRGVLQQSSDLYVHNPGTIAMEIVLEFRKRGLPEVNPPKATRTIQPGATLYVADVLKELFNWENIVGFVTITRTKGNAQPVMTSFNTTFGADGSQFGQTIPGVSLSVETATATAGSRVQYLVGLNDNGDREAYFGITNPNAEPATYRLKFFDSLGRPIGTSSTDLRLSAFGLKQFQPAEVRSQFGLNTQDDYRVEVETVSGGQLFPYGANVRTTSDDPSFLGVGLSNKSKLYLIGALSSPGINNTKWQTDLVVANTGTGVALTDVTFTKAGLTAQPTTPVRLTLQSGETQRLENIVATKWNIKDSVGVLTIESDSTNSVFPIVQGESYETTHTSAGMRFGQFMAAFTDEDAAGPGQAHFLVGLRQDANSRTTYWLYNPSNESGSYDLIYRALDGTELGRIAAASLGAGKLRQLSPSQHPLPAAGASGGFTVQVVVRSGKVLSAAQVINNKTNDPAYVQGQAQK